MMRIYSDLKTSLESPTGSCRCKGQRSTWDIHARRSVYNENKEKDSFFSSMIITRVPVSINFLLHVRKSVLILRTTFHSGKVQSENNEVKRSP